jgi:hypothetical protein
VTTVQMFHLYCAILVGIVSVARTARFLIFDDFPPMMWLRTRFLARFEEDNAWSKIAECPFCLTPYLAAGMLAWGWLAWNGHGLHPTWWVINGIWAASYVAAIVVSYDQPD